MAPDKTEYDKLIDWSSTGPESHFESSKLQAFDNPCRAEYLNVR